MSVGLVAKLEDLRKTYQMGPVKVEALRGVDLEFRERDYVAIMGPSGCGKSTMLNVLGCLDRPTSGRYFLGEDDVSQLDDDALSAIRGKRIGFIFQSYNLIQQLTVIENIEIPLYYLGCPPAMSREIAEELAVLVGLQERLDHKPYELSGGQQQRVAIARALSTDPLFILADEPTGNLDSRSGAEILDIFDGLQEQGKTLVMVTHEEDVAQRTKRVVRLRDGRVEKDTYN